MIMATDFINFKFKLTGFILDFDAQFPNSFYGNPFPDNALACISDE